MCRKEIKGRNCGGLNNSRAGFGRFLPALVLLCLLTASVLHADTGRPPGPDAVMLSDLPVDYSWWYGCVPTATGMLFGYWENKGFDAFPGTHSNLPSSFPNKSSDPADFRDARGIIAGYAHALEGQEDVINYGSFRYHLADSIADFLRTYNGNTGIAVNGIMNFGAWDDPRTPEIESRRFTADTVFTKSGTSTARVRYNWTFEDYVAEIDAGRPALLVGTRPGGGETHVVLGVGYNNTGGRRNVIVNTTWGWGLNEWEWTSETVTGYNFTINGGTVVKPILQPTPKLSAYFHIDRSMDSTPGNTTGMEVILGHGNPESPTWSTIVPVDQYTTTQTDIDLLSQLNLFENSTLDWFLKVSFGRGGNFLGDFQIRYGFDELVYFTSDGPIEILAGSSATMLLTTTGVPEPATFALLGLGALMLLRRRRASQAR